MGINFGDNGNTLKNIAAGIGSFLRSQKTAGSDSATGAQSMQHLMGANMKDEFAANAAVEMQQAAEREEVDFKAETEEACEWAAQQSLAEAVDHFENEEVGNGLMLMSIIE